MKARRKKAIAANNMEIREQKSRKLFFLKKTIVCQNLFKVFHFISEALCVALWNSVWQKGNNFTSRMLYKLNFSLLHHKSPFLPLMEQNASAAKCCPSTCSLHLGAWHVCLSMWGKGTRWRHSWGKLWGSRILSKEEAFWSGSEQGILLEWEKQGEFCPVQTSLLKTLNSTVFVYSILLNWLGNNFKLTV